MGYKQIFALLLPVFVDAAFIVLLSIANTAMISSSGMAAISAVSIIDTVNMFMISLFIAVATGGTVIVAQYRGSGNTEAASKAAGQALMFVTLLSVVVCALVICFNGPILGLLFGNAEQDVLSNATVFLIGSCLSYPFLAIYYAVTGALRGVAETKPTLMLSLILNLSYFLLNIVLVTLLDLGVFGLSISLIAARVLGMAASLIYLLKYHTILHIKLKEIWRMNRALLKKIMYIGLPFATEQVFFNGGKILTQMFMVQLGTLALSINAIGNSLAMVFQIGASAVSVAIVTVVGQCIGQQNVEDARKLTRSLMWLASIFFVAIALIMLPLYPYIVQIFSPPDEIVQPIFELILLIAITQPLFWSTSFVLPAALRSAGDSKYTSIVAMLTMWLFRIGLGYVLGITLGYGILGIWIAMVGEWGVRSVFYLWRFRGDKWYKHKLI